MLLSPKQTEFIQKADRRWNFKGGATRSGKTYLDFRWTIPMRIRERIGKPGLTVILGVTKSTIERNVLEPMRNLYGADLVGSISSDNTAWIFGEKCYCLGAEKVSQVSKIRGSSIKYCYGDEVADWSEEVFELLKSRLDREYSCFDGTFNPQFPTHWLKKFLDSDADIFSQTYTLDDNPFLPESFKENLKKEYSGTVFYDRYILGLWVRAEGAIYPLFADNPGRYAVARADLPEFEYITIGVDFGGNKSAYAFVAAGITSEWTPMALRSERVPATGISVEQMIRRFVRFADGIKADYGRVDYVYADCAEQAIINSMYQQTEYNILGSIKGEIIDRIRTMDLLLSTDRFKYVDWQCDSLKAALCDAVWDSEKLEDVRLDDGTSDIDTLDAWEYSWSAFIKQILRSE